MVQVITSGGVTYRNEPWHRECFTCTNCTKWASTTMATILTTTLTTTATTRSLAGQRFTSREDKPYCAECFGQLFSKRCTACGQPITGEWWAAVEAVTPSRQPRRLLRLV